jgi:hypothetical protein
MATTLRDLGAARFDFRHWLAWPKRMHHEAAPRLPMAAVFWVNVLPPRVTARTVSCDRSLDGASCAERRFTNSAPIYRASEPLWRSLACLAPCVALECRPPGHAEAA